MTSKDRLHPMELIESLSFSPFTIPLSEPFGIATGAHIAAENVLVRLRLMSGASGLGEAAPVPHISGETRARVLARESEVRDALEGRDLRAFRGVSAVLGEVLADVPSARAAVEMAVLDALFRTYGLSFAHFFGGAETRLTTDITITTGSVEHAEYSAARARSLGFRELKVKIGGVDLDHDVRRLRAVAKAAPECEWILDGNTAFSATSALELLELLGAVRERIVLFEQPVAREDWDGLAEVARKGHVLVAADESLRSREDFQRIVRTPGIGAVNIKTAKLGVIGALDLLQAAQGAGLVVMVGGMVETEISMGVSACLAAGVGGVRFIDLDTPLFMGARPLSGGYAQEGPLMDVSVIRAGHGVSFDQE